MTRFAEINENQQAGMIFYIFFHINKLT